MFDDQKPFRLGQSCAVFLRLIRPHSMQKAVNGIIFSALSLLAMSTNANAQVSFEGKFEQGALIRGQAPAGTQVSLNGEALRVTPDGHFAFGFDRDGEQSQQLTLVYPDGLTEVKPLTVAQRQYDIQNVKGISNKIMKPDPIAQERAAKDTAQVKAARATFSEQTGRSPGVFRGYTVVSVFIMMFPATRILVSMSRQKPALWLSRPQMG